MKPTFTIFLIICILAGITSCDKTKNDKAIQELTTYNEALKNMLKEDSVMHLQELNMLREQYEKEIEQLKKSTELQKHTKGYFVVVGSFKNPANVKRYADEIKSKGYEGAIVDGPNNFTLVTSGTFTNLQDALKAYTEARNNIISTAWVYVKR